MIKVHVTPKCLLVSSFSIIDIGNTSNGLPANCTKITRCEQHNLKNEQSKTPSEINRRGFASLSYAGFNPHKTTRSLVCSALADAA